MIFTTGKQYYHGFILKLLAIVCKVLFLFYIVPHLKDKVFSEYVYYLTVSIFISRFVCWGANDQIPTVVNKKKVHELDFWVFLFFILSFICMLTSMYFEIAVLSTVSIVVVMITETILEGMLILLSMKTYEKLLNLPWVIFIGILLFQPGYNTVELLNTYNLAYVTTHAVIIFLFLGIRYKTLFKEYFSFFEIVKLMRGGYLKVINQLLFLINIRGLIILPKLLKGIIVSDTIALGITIAESISTIFMVVINRNFSNYCKNQVNQKESFLNSFKVSTLFLGTGILFSLCCYLFLSLNSNYLKLEIPLDKIDPSILFCSFSIFSAALGFVEIRNYFWSIKKKETVVLLILAMAFLVQGFCVFYLRIEIVVFIIPLSLIAILYSFLAKKMIVSKKTK